MLAIAGGISSCSEEFNLCGYTEDDLEMAEGFEQTTSHFINIVSKVDRAMRNNDLQVNGSAIIDGADVTRSNDTISFDYGTTNVSCADGKLRRGKLVGYITGNYFQQGGSIALAMENYFVENTPITGNMILSNTGVNSNSNYIINLSTSNFAIDTMYDYNVNYSLEWLSGYATRDTISDDVFTLSGIGSGNDNIDTTVFSISFTDPMMFDRGCQYGLSKGIVELNITSPSKDPMLMSVDFKDNDGCNNVAEYSLDCDGTSVSFTQNFSGFELD